MAESLKDAEFRPDAQRAQGAFCGGTYAEAARRYLELDYG